MFFLKDYAIKGDCQMTYNDAVYYKKKFFYRSTSSTNSTEQWNQWKLTSSTKTFFCEKVNQNIAKLCKVQIEEIS